MITTELDSVGGRPFVLVKVHGKAYATIWLDNTNNIGVNRSQLGAEALEELHALIVTLKALEVPYSARNDAIAELLRRHLK